MIRWGQEMGHGVRSWCFAIGPCGSIGTMEMITRLGQKFRLGTACPTIRKALDSMSSVVYEMSHAIAQSIDWEELINLVSLVMTFGDGLWRYERQRSHFLWSYGPSSCIVCCTSSQSPLRLLVHSCILNLIATLGMAAYPSPYFPFILTQWD